MDENAVRWRVWRLAVMVGHDWSGTYQWCLHPKTRAPLEVLLEHYPRAAPRPGPTDPVEAEFKQA